MRRLIVVLADMYEDWANRQTGKVKRWLDDKAENILQKLQR